MQNQITQTGQNGTALTTPLDASPAIGNAVPTIPAQPFQLFDGEALYRDYGIAKQGLAWDGTALKKFRELPFDVQLAWQYAAINALARYSSRNNY